MKPASTPVLAQLSLSVLAAFAVTLGMGSAAGADEAIVVHHPMRAERAQTPPAAQAALPQLLKEVEAKYFKASTLTANFNESDESAATKQTKKSSGKIQFKRPGKIYWETLQPDHNILIGDGKKFWFYTPPFDQGEAGQYWERSASQVQTKFAQGLLAGTFSYNVSNGSMTVKQKSATDFAITPKKGTGGSVKEAMLHVDPSTHLITGIDLLHRGGNKSKISLSDIQLGKPLDDSLFHFTPPPNTEKMKDE